MKWKCDICGKEFDNFHAQGFNNKIYCPLCFFKEENRQLKSTLEEIREYVNNHIHQETFTGYMDSYELKKLLQIIDKGREGK